MSAPETLADLIWYALGGVGSLLLLSIKSELKGMRDDLREERRGRELLAIEVAGIKARCLAYHDRREDDRVS